MATIKAHDRLTIAEAKRRILEASPRELFVDVYERDDGELRAVRDNTPRSIFAGHIDEDFAENCDKLGIVPAWKYRPGKTGYQGKTATDELYTITQDELHRLAALYGVSLDVDAATPHFVTEARPSAVPAELLALHPDARVTYEERIGGQHGSGTTTAGAYRDTVRETIARQAERYLTLNEAAQVLGDSRPGLDPKEAVKRFRLAHSKRELPIHKGGSRFPLEVGETIRDFHDLLDVAELDAWLRRSAGYGFPSAEGAAVPHPTAAPETSNQPRARLVGNDEWRELARDEARRIIKREAGLDRFPPQHAIAEQIAADFRKRKPPIHGTDGKPLTGATIKRHALKGISSATKKARALRINRGK